MHSAASRRRPAPPPREPLASPTAAPLPDALTQIRQARDAIVAAVIGRAIKDGCYQRAKWLFEFAAIAPAAADAADEEPGLLRLIWEQLQIPEPPEDFPEEISANDHAVE